MTFEEIKKSLSLIENPVDKLEMVMDFGKNREIRILLTKDAPANAVFCGNMGNVVKMRE